MSPSIRFNIGDQPDGTLVSLGMTIDAQGRLAQVNSNSAITQSIKLLLATTPGERVMLPDYGCNLEQLVFSNNDATTAGLAIHYVSQAIRQWEPEISLLEVDASASEKKKTCLEIYLKYRIKDYAEIGQMTYVFDLQDKE